MGKEIVWLLARSAMHSRVYISLHPSPASWRCKPGVWRGVRWNNSEKTSGTPSIRPDGVFYGETHRNYLCQSELSSPLPNNVLLSPSTVDFPRPIFLVLVVIIGDDLEVHARTD